ncbi:Diphthamide biosynthesis protein 4 [Phialemonium atrogriseum]|uniref:Diphthamide biosynthesis protein 4 n=1 Tax=Phialemonium atrogriseum TaxID=1093897 RepID=A0AAJ0C6F4_9PEZI|nr:Diphthamide biosynthesis protein 4 [Phialemonium atrogriseum]KAK1769582.1 Diphthamide biosynthesis protein 4 [Phialemonium atrogriseum]
MSSTPASHAALASYYEVLHITPAALDNADDPAQTLKRAYRRALLRHHPDKKENTPTLKAGPCQRQNQHQPAFTVDQISAALAALSDPRRRADHDRALRLGQFPHPGDQQQQQQQGADFQTGVETADLDDLAVDVGRGQGRERDQWYRGCRCGNPRGFLLGEDDLEAAADCGELMVGCQDCSLWLRVRFAVVEDEDEDEDEDDGAGRLSADDGREGGG